MSSRSRYVSKYPNGWGGRAQGAKRLDEMNKSCCDYAVVMHIEARQRSSRRELAES